MQSHHIRLSFFHILIGDIFRAILAAPWYLNDIVYGVDWDVAYNHDPTDMDFQLISDQIYLSL